MKEEITYLSDEELDRLITEVEQGEMIQAPPDMAESIWNGIHENKVREFRAYCFRVVASVAAAVVLVFTLPAILNGQETGVKPNLEYISREEILERNSLTEFLNGNSIFGSSSIFGRNASSDNDREWNIFK